VLLLNDDYTPMEFVVMVLKRFFAMDLEQATRVMLHVHQRGVGVCGIFPYEIAETKVNQVMDFARENQHPCNARWKRHNGGKGLRSPGLALSATPVRATDRRAALARGGALSYCTSPSDRLHSRPAPGPSSMTGPHL
jgi:ATP-dependent Clp protease adapter protein ClpS